MFCVFPANQSLADFGLFCCRELQLQNVPWHRVLYPDFWTLRNLVKMACPSVSPFSIYVTYQNISATWSSCSVGTTILVSSEQCPMGLWQPRQIDILKMRHWLYTCTLPADSRLLMVSVHWGRHKCIFYFSSQLLGAKNCADSPLVKEDTFESLWVGGSLLD